MTPDLCPHCGQVMPNAVGSPITEGELEALSAWWLTGTVKKAADLLGRSQRTVVNQLYSARNRNGVHTTLELLQLHIGQLRSRSDLITKHNVRAKEAA